MPLEIPANVPPTLLPIAWLLGTWEGVGVVGYPTIEEKQFGQRVVFSNDGRPFISYTSHTWLLDDQGKQVRPLATEMGFWRVVVPEDPEAAAKEAAGIDVELLLTHPTGFIEMYVGRASAGRIELATDVVARAPGAKEYTSATRMYGRVEGDLLWVMDMAAMGQPMTSHVSARLNQVAIHKAD